MLDDNLVNIMMAKRIAESIDNLAISNMANAIANSQSETNSKPENQNIDLDLDVNIVSEEDKRSQEWNENLQTIIEAKSSCFTKLLYNTCKDEECNSCDRNKLINECYNALPSCDKLKVDMAHEKFMSKAIKKKVEEDAELEEIKRKLEEKKRIEEEEREKEIQQAAEKERANRAICFSIIIIIVIIILIYLGHV